MLAKNISGSANGKQGWGGERGGGGGGGGGKGGERELEI